MSRVTPLVCPLLVGRDDLLDLADRRIAEAAAGHGQFLFLAGQAGIGKTRFLEAVWQKAVDAGFRWASADLAPQDRQVPMASILDMARTMRRSPDFGGLGAELLALQGDRGGDSLGSRRLLVHEVAERIVASIDRPTLLSFEDLQWADELSLEVIGDVARVGRDLPVLLVGAYRLDELPVGSIHREWRSRLLSQRLAEEARLAPLTYEQTALATTLILATGLPAPREVVSAIYERTDGIPLHIEELLGVLGDDARRDGRAIRDAEVPDTIEDAILARVAGLSTDAKAVARAGAVLGRCFVPGVLAGIMDRPVAELDAPLQELVANSFLFQFGAIDEGYHDFRHQLLRDALYNDLSTGELRRLHARAGEFGADLEGATEIHASVHFERAGLRAEAYRAALAGAEAASAISSRQEAFELYTRAVANIPDDLPATDLARLYHAYMETASAVDNVAVTDEAAHLARRYDLEAGRVLEAVETLVTRANTARRDVRPMAERRDLLDRAETELATLPDSPDRTMVLSDVRVLEAVLALDNIRLADASKLLDEARHLRATASDPDTGDIDFIGGEVDILAGRTVAGLETMMRTARKARDARHEATGVTAYRGAAAFAARIMDYGMAEVGLNEGLRYADEIEQSYCRHVMAATSALVAWAAGRWNEAIPIAGIEIVERGSLRGTLGSRDALGYVSFGRGDVDRARSLLGESLALGRRGGEVELILPPLWGLAETALVAGEPTIAVECCREALEVATATGERPLIVPFVVTGVRASLALLRPEAAEAWAGAVRRHLADWAALARPALDHAEGLIRVAAGSTASARELLEAAVRGWDERRRIWESTWARLDLATCLLRSNRYAEATTVLSDVRDTAVRLDSPPLLARVDELAGNARRHGSFDEPWRPLTGREFEVARLIGEGLTNAEIAGALSIAPKTASAHVEHILAKLGVARRAEVASWVATIARGAESSPAGPPSVGASR